MILSPLAVQRFYDNNNNPAVKAQMFAYVAGTTTKQSTYSDSAGTLNTNPIILNFRGEANIWLDPTKTYKFVFAPATDTDPPTNPFWTVDNIPGGYGGTINYTQIVYPQTAAELAASVTPVNLYKLPGHVLRYHATGTIGVSATNDTAAVKAVFDVCIKAMQLGGTSSCDGDIIAGNYKINEGVLVFDNNYTTLPFPKIYTDGYDCVTFTGQNFADAPMIKLSCGTATSGAPAPWSGGFIGGITYKTTRVGGSNSHGLSINGLWSLRFGVQWGVGLFGSVVYNPLNIFSGFDPDPYSVNFCVFEGIYSQGCDYAFYNANGIGLSANIFQYIGGTSNRLGGAYLTGGTGNIYQCFAFASCSGYAIDYNAAACNREWIQDAEIDGCQYGFRVNAGFQNKFLQMRMVHRYQTSPNAAANYWPRIAVDITGLSSPSLTSTEIEVIHRINTGGALKDLGVFCDFHNSNAATSDVTVKHNLSNQSAISTGLFVDSLFVRNLGASTNAAVFRDGRRIGDNRIAPAAILSGNATTSILNGGFGTVANIVLLPTTTYDPYGSVNANSEWVAPYTGRARFMANFALTMAAGNKVRMAIGEIVINAIATTGTLVAGTGYTNGVYAGVIVNGGTGSGAIATITVAGGVVTVVAITNTGSNYTVGDVLSVVNQDIGGTGTGFSFQVATVTASAYSATLLARALYAPTANVQSYSIEGLIAVTKGFAYALVADQNSGGNLAPTLVSGNYAPDVYMHVEMISQP